jgi:RimJ/RimL family protein N-acetyltransferase
VAHDAHVPVPVDVRLRAVHPRDVSALYDFETDAEANRLAAVRPREEQAFHARWHRTLRNPAITARAIVADGVLAGRISCFPVGAERHVGYWIARAHWNRGIATQALGLLLEEIATRPLHACVAEPNLASLRVLQRCGFQVTGERDCPADDRLSECREVLLVLA